MTKIYINITMKYLVQGVGSGRYRLWQCHQTLRHRVSSERLGTEIHAHAQLTAEQQQQKNPNNFPTSHTSACTPVVCHRETRFFFFF